MVFFTPDDAEVLMHVGCVEPSAGVEAGDYMLHVDAVGSWRAAGWM